LRTLTNCDAFLEATLRTIGSVVLGDYALFSFALSELGFPFALVIGCWF
jgi:hypothetical protein